MRIETTILIATHDRNHLLIWNLLSLKRQNLGNEIEVIVLDDFFEGNAEHTCKHYDVRYVHTGKQKTGNIYRIPGFAFNIGAKQAKGKYIILLDGEIYHHNDTIHQIINPLRENSRALTIPFGKDAQNKPELTEELNHNGFITDEHYEVLPDLKTGLPFLMGMSKDEFVSIGGYDEDFTGISFDDNDLVMRLTANGCRYHQTDAKIVHLHYSRKSRKKAAGYIERKNFNRRLFSAKTGTIFRNEGREWGVL